MRTRGDLAAISANVKTSAAAPVGGAEAELRERGAGVFTCLCCDAGGGVVSPNRFPVLYADLYF